MISLAPGTKVFLACRPIDLRAGFNGLAAKVQQVIGQNPFDGSLFIFRGKRGDYFKAIYWDGSGLWLLSELSGFILQLLRLETRILIPLSG